MSLTLWEILFLAESLMNLSIAPLLQILSQSIDKLLPRPHWVDIRDQRFLTNKDWPCLTPLSTAGVSE